MEGGKEEVAERDSGEAQEQRRLSAGLEFDACMTETL